MLQALIIRAALTLSVFAFATAATAAGSKSRAGERNFASCTKSW